MGIINLTPDSFYEGSRYSSPLKAVEKAAGMLKEGAGMLDLGAASTRPGAGPIKPEEEKKRLLPALQAILREFPDALVSVDTYHAETARASVGEGAGIINDISAGSMDPAMARTVAGLGVPYVLMHMQGTPATMQDNPRYTHLIREITGFFDHHIARLLDLGVHDIILDPGFGFGKTVEHNYELLAGMDFFHLFERPLMVGLSRKSMVTRVLGVPPGDALNGTTVLHAVALMKGAAILRVHDVREAVEAVKIVQAFQNVRQLD
jgi:dihydropteroate synthase